MYCKANHQMLQKSPKYWELFFCYETLNLLFCEQSWYSDVAKISDTNEGISLAVGSCIFDNIKKLSSKSLLNNCFFLKPRQGIIPQSPSLIIPFEEVVEHNQKRSSFIIGIKTSLAVRNCLECQNSTKSKLSIQTRVWETPWNNQQHDFMRDNHQTQFLSETYGKHGKYQKLF